MLNLFLLGFYICVMSYFVDLRVAALQSPSTYEEHFHKFYSCKIKGSKAKECNKMVMAFLDAHLIYFIYIHTITFAN